jgi:5'-nucleotidase
LFFRMVAYRVVVMAIVGLGLLAAPAQAAPNKKRPPKPVKIQLLGINDFHGHMDGAGAGTITRTGAPEDRVPAGGAEYLATNLRLLRHRNPNTVVVGAGDLVGGSPLESSLFHDEPAIELMNKVGMWASAVGNHEFDEGLGELRRLQHGGCHPGDGCRDGTPFTGAKFRYLSANAVDRRTGKQLFRGYAIRRIGGVKIGFIGLTTKETPQFLSPSRAAGLRFRDEALSANRAARALKRRGVRAIVALMHEGAFAQRSDVSPNACPGLKGRFLDIIRHTTRDVDVFLTAHTHAAYNCVVGGRHVIQGGSYGRLIMRVDLAVNRRTGEIQHVDTRNWVVGQDVPPAPDITRLLAHYNHFVAPTRDRLVGRMARFAGRTRDPSGESKMGDLVADAQRSAAGSDVAFVNFGVVRASLPRGDITYGRAFTSQPFGTTLVTMTMSGSQIRELLKQQWCGRATPNVLQPSANVHYTWSRAAVKPVLGVPCSQAADPTIDLTINGQPVPFDSAYRVTVNSSLANGGDGFSVLHTGMDPVDGSGDADALATYLQPTLDGEPLLPPARDRITVVP